MSNLLIEQLTEEYSGSSDMNKVASELEALDQSRTLVACGEELFKFASHYENEVLAALASDTYDMGIRMGACLSKVASEEGIFDETVDMTEDMQKIASVWAEIGDETGDEDFCKMAEAIIDIANCMHNDLEDLIKEASIKSPDFADNKYEKVNGKWVNKGGQKLSRTGLEGASEETASELKAAMKAQKAADLKKNDVIGSRRSMKEGIESMITKARMLKRYNPALFYSLAGGVAAAGAGAGYGAYRYAKNRK